ncbi:MAG TPA: hypothetical protein VJ548_03405 [Azospira sp.]|nr:hypothetical protein [Azospira sp.]
MAKTVTISSTENIQWPESCSKCCSNETLAFASATSGRVTSVSPTLTGAVRIKSELLDLSFPVCKNHASGLGMANFFTRNTSGIKMLRGFFYLLGPISLLIVGTFLFRLVTQHQSKSELPLGMMSLFVFCSTIFILILNSYRTLPVRISKQTEDFVSIRFANDLYAKEFARKNRHQVIDN